MSVATGREGRSALLIEYPKLLKIAIVAICTTSALSLNCRDPRTFITKTSAAISKKSVDKSKTLFRSMKMMTTGNKGRELQFKKDILALDFDGVVCASSVESSFSSIVAAEKFWPMDCKIMVTPVLVDEIDSSSTLSSYSSLETEAEDSNFCRIRSAINQLRPIVETGFENMLLVRVVFEELRSTGKIDVLSLKKRWSPVYRDQLIAKYGTSKEELVAFFGKVRDDLINENLDAWVSLNQVYPCVSDCLSGILPQKLSYTIITTKQERFVKAILEKNDINPPAKENIYDLDNPHGAKTKVLAALIEQHNRDENRDKNKEVVIHFVEDRFETLLAVTKIPALDSVQLYLVDWGYNTRSQREEAKKLFPRIKLINGEDFKALATSFIQ